MALLLLTFVALLAIGLPIAFAMLGSAMLAIWIDGFPMTVFAQRVSSGVQSFPLLAVPLFILAGNLMNQSGMSERMFAFARALIGHVRGGLAQVNVIASVFMSGISGSSLADCAATTRVFVPEMEKAGYTRAFSVALTASSATLAPIIPPSILLIIYAWVANISIGDFFIAGIIPGLLIGAVLLGVTALMARARNFPVEGSFSRSALRRTFGQAGWALLLPVLIVGGFRAGIFTATEVAAVAVAYSLLVGALIYRTLDWRGIGMALLSTARDTASILLLVAAASPFAWMLAMNNAPQVLLGFITSISDHPVIVLLLLNVMLLVLGTFMETLAVIIILVPILIPLLNMMDISLVHFGILMIVNLLVGQLTPPLGVLMFVSCSIARVRMGAFLREVWPFLLGLLAALLVITLVPALTLWLPEALR
ncbi:TRAP transporter large permease [Aquibaculum sediminis]|uniref:TRAP transporter large permease n=1 Tax=Aquibaculum sediminis TaxID=3231907 RepID=UPI0034549A49